MKNKIALNKFVLIGILLVIGFGFLLLGSIGFFIIYKSEFAPSENSSTGKIIPNNNQPCQPIVYSPNVRWICGKPNYIICPNLGIIMPSVTNTDTSSTIVVPANEQNGVTATGFYINKGDKIEISTQGKIKFSNDHPCVDGNGMAGWEDLGVDSPFNHNVGGLEFSIGSLYDNRYFAGNYYQAVAETSGTPIFRVIESIGGYSDNNSGAFTVMIKKVK